MPNSDIVPVEGEGSLSALFGNLGIKDSKPPAVASFLSEGKAIESPTELSVSLKGNDSKPPIEAFSSKDSSRPYPTGGSAVDPDPDDDECETEIHGLGDNTASSGYLTRALDMITGVLGFWVFLRVCYYIRIDRPP